MVERVGEEDVHGWRKRLGAGLVRRLRRCVDCGLGAWSSFVLVQLRLLRHWEEWVKEEEVLREETKVDMAPRRSLRRRRLTGCVLEIRDVRIGFPERLRGYWFGMGRSVGRHPRFQWKTKAEMPIG